MTREDVLTILAQAIPDLKARYAVEHLDIFGSFARDEARLDSDVDILVTFAGTPTFNGYMGLKEDLEARLGRKVDLVTYSGLKPRIKGNILSELLHVA
jgi:uncharacterized protein